MRDAWARLRLLLIRTVQPSMQQRHLHAELAVGAGEEECGVLSSASLAVWHGAQEMVALRLPLLPAGERDLRHAERLSAR